MLLRDLATKVLEPDDTMALMKAITPDREAAGRLQEQGSCDFGFAFKIRRRRLRGCRRLPAARSSARSGHIGIVLRKIPYKLLDFRSRSACR